jgi:hypothetical protein
MKAAMGKEPAFRHRNTSPNYVTPAENRTTLYHHSNDTYGTVRFAGTLRRWIHYAPTGNRSGHAAAGDAHDGDVGYAE